MSTVPPQEVQPERSDGPIPVRGSTSAKKLLLSAPLSQNPMDASSAVADADGNGAGGKGVGDATQASAHDNGSAFAGGAVDGEIVMGQTTGEARDDTRDLVAQAAAALGDDTAEL